MFYAPLVHAKKEGKAIFIDKTALAESTWKGIIDYWIERDCDEWVAEVIYRSLDTIMVESMHLVRPKGFDASVPEDYGPPFDRYEDLGASAENQGRTI